VGRLILIGCEDGVKGVNSRHKIRVSRRRAAVTPAVARGQEHLRAKDLPGDPSVMDIRRITATEPVMAAGHLFDDAPLPEATERFLAAEGHHLLIGYADGVPAGMVTGVEMTHPDKGTEMFLVWTFDEAVSTS
jgi:hypothetical protein